MLNNLKVCAIDLEGLVVRREAANQDVIGCVCLHSNILCKRSCEFDELGEVNIVATEFEPKLIYRWLVKLLQGHDMGKACVVPILIN